MRQSLRYNANTEEKSSQFLNLLINPFRSPASPYPDSNPTPFVLKTINYVASKTLVQPTGMFVRASSSLDIGIRHYGFDTVTQTMNLIEVIRPDEDLPTNFLKARHISSGVMYYSNTIAAGAFAVAGTLTGISYIALPPVTTITPQTLTVYKADDLNVAASIASVEGIVEVAPLTESHEFRVFDIPQIFDYMVDTTFTNTIPAGVYPVNAGVYSIYEWNSTSTQPVPTPLAWGHVKVDIRIVGNVVGVASPTLDTFTVQINVIRRYANPATYQYAPLFATRSFECPLVSDDNGAFQIVSLETTFQDFDEAEIDSITVSIVDNSGLYGQLSLFQGCFMTVHCPDYLKYTTKEPGNIVVYDSISTGQQMSISGRAHYEVIPNADLVKNIGTYYSIEDNMQMQVAVNALAAGMATGALRFLYRRSEYGVPQYSEDQVVYMAATRSKFLNTILGGLKRAAPAIISGVGQAAGLMFGNPALGTALSEGGNLLYNGLTGSKAKYLTATKEQAIITPAEACQHKRLNIHTVCIQHLSMTCKRCTEHTHVTVCFNCGETKRTDIKHLVNDSLVYRASSTLGGLGNFMAGAPKESVPIPQAPQRDVAVIKAEWFPTWSARDPLGVAKTQFLERGNMALFSSDPRWPTDKYLHGFCPTILENEGQVVGVVSCLTITLKPVSFGNNAEFYEAVMLGERKCYKDSYMPPLSENLKKVMMNSIFLNDPRMLGGTDPLYFTHIPSTYKQLKIEGFSHELALANAAIGCPAVMLMSGSVDPNYEVTQIESKTELALSVDGVIGFMNPDMDQFRQTQATLKKGGLGFSRIDVPYTLAQYRTIGFVQFTAFDQAFLMRCMLTVVMGSAKISTVTGVVNEGAQRSTELNRARDESKGRIFTVALPLRNGTFELSEKPEMVMPIPRTKENQTRTYKFMMLKTADALRDYLSKLSGQLGMTEDDEFIKSLAIAIPRHFMSANSVAMDGLIQQIKTRLAAKSKAPSAKGPANTNQPKKIGGMGVLSRFSQAKPKFNYLGKVDIDGYPLTEEDEE